MVKFTCPAVPSRGITILSSFPISDMGWMVPPVPLPLSKINSCLLHAASLTSRTDESNARIFRGWFIEGLSKVPFSLQMASRATPTRLTTRNSEAANQWAQDRKVFPVSFHVVQASQSTKKLAVHSSPLRDYSPSKNRWARTRHT